MRKKLLFLGILVFACSANAQFFVGGSIGVGFYNDKNDEGKSYSQSFNVGFAPEVGYSITKKIDVGLNLDFTYQQEKEWLFPGSNQTSKTDVYSWRVAPFVQYHFAKWGKFDFIGRGVAHFGSMIYDGNMPFTYGFSVYPTVHFNLNNHFILLTDLNFLSLNIHGSFAKDEGRDFGFYFGANSGNVLNLSQVRIGFIYKFKNCSKKI